MSTADGGGNGLMYELIDSCRVNEAMRNNRCRRRTGEARLPPVSIPLANHMPGN